METAEDRITIPQDGARLVVWAFTVDGAPYPDPTNGWDGWTGKIQVRESRVRGAQLVAELDAVMGSDGRIAADFTPAIVSALKPGTYRGDVRAVAADGWPEYPVAFELTITPSTTAPWAP